MHPKPTFATDAATAEYYDRRAAEYDLWYPAAATSLRQLGDDILAFEAGYQEMAKPFEWKFTRAVLDELLDRLSALASAA